MEWQYQQQYWNQAAGEKEFRTPLQIDIINRYIGKDASILDFGCGYGRILKELQQAGYTNLQGTDLSAAMIERAQINCPQAEYRVNTGYNIPFPDGSMDLVVLVAVLTSIPQDKNQFQTVKEIERVLKPGGYLYVNDFLLNQDARNLQRYQQSKDIYDCYGVFELPDGGVQRHHDSAYVKGLLGIFNTVVYEETVYTTMNGNPSNGFYYLGQKQG